MIKQIGLPLRGRPILLITHMITDRIGLHSVLLPLQIIIIITKGRQLMRWFIRPAFRISWLKIQREKTKTRKGKVQKNAEFSFVDKGRLFFTKLSLEEVEIFFTAGRSKRNQAVKFF